MWGFDLYHHNWSPAGPFIWSQDVSYILHNLKRGVIYMLYFYAYDQNSVSEVDARKTDSRVLDANADGDAEPITERM